MRNFISVAAAAALALAWPATASSQQPELQLMHTDSLRLSAGPAWHHVRSRHFSIYTETTTASNRTLLGAVAGASNRILLDSLEEAWTHANALLGLRGADTANIVVFVTASRTRFPRVMASVTKGRAGRSLDGHYVIILVQNDSVRAYTRHEVMHIVAMRSLPHGSRSSGAWLHEGLATFADGLCQGVPISVVARDVLRAQPLLTIRQLTTNFRAMHERSRGATYVLAGSLVEYLWNARGREGVERLFVGIDSLAPAFVPQSGLGTRENEIEIMKAWRAYTERVAAGRQGLLPQSLQRHGCG